MSDKIPDTAHPDSLDDAARAAMQAELDNEDAELGEQHDENGDDAAADPTATDEADAGGEPGSDGETATPSADPATTPEDEAKPIDAKAFNGVLTALRETREELKALKASQAAPVAVPDARDFAAERAALKEQWNDGDLDTDAYNDARDALVLEEAEHRSAVRFHSMQQQAASEAATTQWQEKVTAWQTENADFLANPIRRKAVGELMAELEASGEKLTDEELLAKVQETAFDAFNWTATPGAPAAPAVDQRAVANARAASAASAAPPSIAGRGGMGSRAVDIDLEALKPGQFKDLPKDVQAALLEED